MIIIHNTLDEGIRGRFAGVDYDFPPKKDVPCDEDAARHIFGFGEPDKAAALLRLGWIIPGQTRDVAEQKLAKVVFKKAEVQITAAKE
jgi:hypothetical protein